MLNENVDGIAFKKLILQVIEDAIPCFIKPIEELIEKLGRILPSSQNYRGRKLLSTDSGTSTYMTQLIQDIKLAKDIQKRVTTSRGSEPLKDIMVKELEKAKKKKSTPETLTRHKRMDGKTLFSQMFSDVFSSLTFVRQQIRQHKQYVDVKYSDDIDLFGLLTCIFSYDDHEDDLAWLSCLYTCKYV